MQSSIRRIVLIRSFVLALSALAFSPLLQAQPPYIEDSRLTLPMVQVSGELYRVELAINASASPISLTLESAFVTDIAVNSTTASMTGAELTVPKIRFGGKNYELVLTLVSSSPVTFQLTGVREVSENFSALDSITYSPEACQADLQLLQEATTVLKDSIEVYKGDYFGSATVTPSGSFARSAFVSLVSNAVLVMAGQQPPNSPDGTIFTLPISEFTLAPDQGLENDPAYPIAFRVNVKESASVNYLALYRSDGKGGLSRVVAENQVLDLGEISGEVDTFYKLTLGPGGALFFILKLKNNDNEYLVGQDVAGGALSLLLSQGSFLNTGDPATVRQIGKIGTLRTNSFYQVIAEIEVVDESQVVEGFAYLATDNYTGSNQCLSTNTSVICGGVLLYNGQTLGSISTDGATTGAVIKSAGDEELQYKVIGQPQVLSVKRGDFFQSLLYNGFKKPQVCDSKNALYFVATFYEQGIGGFDELMRIDELGNFKKLTDFRTLLLNPALKGQVPNEIRNWALGYNCDAALYTWGPSGANSNQGYEGYWASYVTGQTMEILDETPGQSNGNGSITEASRSTSAIDSSADVDTTATTGPNAEFYFLPSLKNAANKYVSNYAVATKPSACN